MLLIYPRVHIRLERPPLILATENDTCNAAVMLFENLLTQRSAVFADVRTYWSPDAVKRVTGQMPSGEAAGGFIHLINSGAAALDATGAQRDEQGNGVMKPWWELTTADISAWLKATRWAPASLRSFRGGSCHACLHVAHSGRHAQPDGGGAFHPARMVLLRRQLR